jgi:hypothetical protein
MRLTAPGWQKVEFAVRSCNEAVNAETNED